MNTVIFEYTEFRYTLKQIKEIEFCLGANNGSIACVFDAVSDNWPKDHASSVVRLIEEVKEGRKSSNAF